MVLVLLLTVPRINKFLELDEHSCINFVDMVALGERPTCWRVLAFQ